LLGDQLQISCYTEAAALGFHGSAERRAAQEYHGSGWAASGKGAFPPPSLGDSKPGTERGALRATNAEHQTLSGSRKGSEEMCTAPPGTRCRRRSLLLVEAKFLSSVPCELWAHPASALPNLHAHCYA